MNDMTAERINAAVQAERRRWIDAQPTVESRLGVTAQPYHLPTFSLTVTGLNPALLRALGDALTRQALDAVKRHVPPEAPEA